MTNEERRNKFKAIREHFVSLGMMKSKNYEEPIRENTEHTNNQSREESQKNESSDW